MDGWHTNKKLYLGQSNDYHTRHKFADLYGSMEWDYSESIEYFMSNHKIIVVLPYAMLDSPFKAFKATYLPFYFESYKVKIPRLFSKLYSN